MHHPITMPNSFWRKLSDPIGLANIQLCPYHVDGVKPSGYIITRIHTPLHHRGRGIARALLAECLAWADITQTMLWLEIAPGDDTTSYDRLQAWYVRNGFCDLGGIYRRKPRQSQP